CCSVVLLALVLTACTPPQTPPDPNPVLKAVTLDRTKMIAGQTLYVPIYSHIYTWEQSRILNLTATLSIRNTDLTHRIIVTAIDYYNSSGKRVRKYLEQPGELQPLAAASFVVNQEDTSGGSGAAFIVEWVAATEVSAPVIEAVMINTSGNQGISFVSPGRVINSRSVHQP
ncbi:MAG TPA: DUF3124 domain-containing protein, partial [Coleofasciculaceae cyanobacterium]